MILSSSVVILLSLVLGNNAFSYNPILMGKSSFEGNSTYGITNGTITNIIKHPYQAAIYYGQQFIASGAILNKRWIITTSSYIFAKSFVEIGKIQVGKTEIQKSTDSNANFLYDIEKIVFHPEYTLGTSYNLGLIRLKTPLELSKGVRTIKIASKSPSKGTKVIISGWGSTENETYSLSKQLRETQLFILPKTDCGPSYIASVVSNTSICAFTDDQTGPSYGDCGDPLVQKKQLVGVFQGIFGPLIDLLCIKPPCPYIFTDLTLVKSWIKQTIRNG